ncbi:phosphate acyltransferase [Mesotoga sp. UBA5847]|jgi:phosphate butyryltransferase|uniref:phosphate acyltransferase n=1 Tax=Mesotoga sp. UBA5847 TaxID=1946859 RepID=UPI0025E4FBC5|nr:phosphate acyltransferase [Mesotoga sp. UBA5847]
MINSLSEFILEASKLQKRVRVNCVQPHDRKTMKTIESTASSNGNFEFTLFGRLEEIKEAASEGFLNTARVVEGESEEDNASNAVAALEGDTPAVLMKGDINTTVFLRELFKSPRVKASGKLISHISCMEVPEHPKLLFITDGTVNVAPDLKEKAEILRNAVEFARSIGISEPRVAVIGINERVSVTNRDLVEGAVLSKMAERGQFGVCLVDGPLPIDTALKKEAALKKGITSKVGGEADILVCSNLESAANLIKGLVHLGKSKTAGLLLGAGFPVVLTSRSDNEFAKAVSLSMALVSAVG